VWRLEVAQGPGGRRELSEAVDGRVGEAGGGTAKRAALAIPPRPRHLSLTRDSGFMVLHKDEVEIGNSG
jgi:hypothetical protein